MKNFPRTFLIASVVLFSMALLTNASNPFDIEYPVPELGDCGSQGECKVYCDDPVNEEACIAFAKRTGIISKEDAVKMEEMKRFEKEEFKGPGGCESRQECDIYCQAPEHVNECLAFSVDEGFMTQEEADKIIERADKVGPGGCDSKEECDAYCGGPENGTECIQFAVDEGFMTQEEADFLLEMMEKQKEFDDGIGGPGGPGGPDDGFDEEKAKELLANQNGPGGCGTMDECETYCGDDTNIEECMDFAVEHGLVPEKEAGIMKEVLENGGPGGCSGPDECDAYCSQDEHMDECIEFAAEHDLMSTEEVENIKKMMVAGGPGGCNGQSECDDFCRKPENIEECMQFSVEVGMMTQEEADKMVDYIRGMEDREERMMEEEFKRNGPRDDMESSRDREHDSQGFQPFGGPPRGDEDFGSPPGSDFGGPGGCGGPDECMEYCSDPANREECEGFMGEKRDFPQEGEFEGRDSNGGEFDHRRPPEDFENFSPQEDFEGFEPPEGFSPPEDFESPEDFGDFKPPEDFEHFGPPEGFEEFAPPSDFESFEPRSFEEPPPGDGNFAPLPTETQAEPISRGTPSLFRAVLAPILMILGF